MTVSAPLRAIAAAACLAFGVPPCAIADPASLDLPTLGEAGGEELSPQDERKIGEQAMLEFHQEPDFLDDPDCTEYLNNLGYQLVAASPAHQSASGRCDR